MLEFSPLDRHNYLRYEQEIMASEKIFPENIRETSENYQEALCQAGVVAFVASVQGSYAGNVLGFQPLGEQRSLLRLAEIDICVDKLIYLFNIVALPEFKGAGVGMGLLNRFLEDSRKNGFLRAGGHFRGNGSLHNFTQRGGEVLATFDNWFDSGETYSYCELHLG
jgi:GNAT superfamily N-acetyltransferase